MNLQFMLSTCRSSLVEIKDYPFLMLCHHCLSVPERVLAGFLHPIKPLMTGVGTRRSPWKAVVCGFSMRVCPKFRGFVIIFFIQKIVTLAGISRTLTESATKRVSKYEKTRATLVGKPMAETRSLFRSWHRHWTGLLCRHDGTDDLQLQVVVTAGANAMAGVVLPCHHVAST